jgi:VanZ family protein
MFDAMTSRLLQGLSQALNAHLAWRLGLGLLVVVVCWLAFSPAPPPQLHTHWDKLNHTLAFAALGWCACLGWPMPPAPRRVAHLLGLALALLAFGAFIEVVQSQLPARSAEWADLLADAVGTLLGGGLAHGVQWLLRRWPGHIRPTGQSG